MYEQNLQNSMYITSSRIEDTESTSFDIQVILVIITITNKKDMTFSQN